MSRSRVSKAKVPEPEVSEAEMLSLAAEDPLPAIQNFNVENLHREAELGTELNFRAVLPDATKLIRLYKSISKDVMDELPDAVVGDIVSQAKNDLSIIIEILDFSPTIGNPSAEREQLIQRLKDAYAAAFSSLHTIVSYGTSTTPEFQRMKDEFNETIREIKGRGEHMIEELSHIKDESKKIDDDLREMAAEQGVSQQAIYFKEEYDSHIKQSKRWRIGTIALASVLGLYALAGFFLHKIPWITTPETTIQAIQLASSKILLFAVISYMLFLASRNFMSHKHNAIVNKHRQNALSTFKALVDAAEGSEDKDVILTHASACIFSPQDTGYEKSSGSSSASNRSVVGLIPKNMFKADS